MNAIADQVMVVRRGLVSRAAEEMARDSRVGALWLGGSSGRGEDDALSDIDLAVVVEDESLVGDRLSVAARLAPLVAHLDSPHNAPIGGGQVNGFYDLSPLPVFVDWNFWPMTRERPSDVGVLFERDDEFVEVDRTYDCVQQSMPRGRAPEPTEHYLGHFRFMMLTIVAKYAARGWDHAVIGLYRIMKEPPPESTDLATVADDLLRLLGRLAQSESAEAVACTRRYLEGVSDVVA